MFLGELYKSKMCITHFIKMAEHSFSSFSGIHGRQTRIFLKSNMASISLGASVFPWEFTAESKPLL